MDLLVKILNVGLSGKLEEHLEQKVKLSNAIAALFIFFAIIYLVMVLFLVPVLVPYMLLAIGLLVSVLFLNAFSLYNLSRFIASVTASIMSFFIHVSLVQQGEPMLTGNSMMQFGFCILPFLLFNIEERLFIFLSFLVCAGTIVVVEPLSGLIETEHPVEIAKTSLMTYINISMGIVILCSSTVVLLVEINNSKKRSQHLIHQAEIRNHELEKQEQERNEYLKEIEINKKEEEKRIWVSKGLAHFSDILRRQQQEQLTEYDALLSEIVKYTGSTQGALFLANEMDGAVQLKLNACYAYDRKKYKSKVIEPGEGLVGQAFLEKQYIYMTRVPDSYVAIRSGLGEAEPASILIIPAILNNEVLGILELASFNEFQKHQIDFLNKVGESLASTIYSLRSIEKTRRLLDEHQRLSEQLKSQEEELRQNTEELLATQEEMERKYTALMKELDSYRNKEAKLK